MAIRSPGCHRVRVLALVSRHSERTGQSRLSGRTSPRQLAPVGHSTDVASGTRVLPGSPGPAEWPWRWRRSGSQPHRDAGHRQGLARLRDGRLDQHTAASAAALNRLERWPPPCPPAWCGRARAVTVHKYRLSPVCFAVALLTGVAPLPAVGAYVGRYVALTAPELSVRGNHLVNWRRTIVRLTGVNRSGAEYACAHVWGIWDAPTDTNLAIRAMTAWHINSVRIPLNEDCWLGINGVPRAYSGARYW